MALSKAETQKLADILHNLKTAQKYISNPKLKLVDTRYTTGMPEDVFINKDNTLTGVSMNKEVGSDIVYLRNAIQKLEYLLYPPKIETDEN